MGRGGERGKGRGGKNDLELTVRGWVCLRVTIHYDFHTK